MPGAGHGSGPPSSSLADHQRTPPSAGGGARRHGPGVDDHLDPHRVAAGREALWQGTVGRRHERVVADPPARLLDDAPGRRVGVRDLRRRVRRRHAQHPVTQAIPGHVGAEPRLQIGACRVRIQRAAGTVRDRQGLFSREICSAPAPSGPRMSSSVTPSRWFQTNEPLPPSPSAASASRPLAVQCCRIAASGRTPRFRRPQRRGATPEQQHPEDRGCGTLHGPARSRRSLRRALSGWRCERVLPGLASLVPIAEGPLHFTEVQVDLRVVAEIAGAHQVLERLGQSPLPESHPAHAVEHGGAVRSLRQRRADQRRGLVEALVAIRQRVAQRVLHHGVVGTVLEELAQLADRGFRLARTLVGEDARHAQVEGVRILHEPGVEDLERSASSRRSRWRGRPARRRPRDRAGDGRAGTRRGAPAPHPVPTARP